MSMMKTRNDQFNTEGYVLLKHVLGSGEFLDAIPRGERIGRKYVYDGGTDLYLHKLPHFESGTGYVSKEGIVGTHSRWNYPPYRHLHDTIVPLKIRDYLGPEEFIPTYNHDGWYWENTQSPRTLVGDVGELTVIKNVTKSCQDEHYINIIDLNGKERLIVMTEFDLLLIQGSQVPYWREYKSGMTPHWPDYPEIYWHNWYGHYVFKNGPHAHYGYNVVEKYYS